MVGEPKLYYILHPSKFDKSNLPINYIIFQLIIIHLHLAIKIKDHFPYVLKEKTRDFCYKK